MAIIPGHTVAVARSMDHKCSTLKSLEKAIRTLRQAMANAVIRQPTKRFGVRTVVESVYRVFKNRIYGNHKRVLNHRFIRYRI